MIRCDKKLGALELILKLPNEIGFVSNIGDNVWLGVTSVIRCDEKFGAWELILKLPNETVFFPNIGDKVC